MIRLSLSVLALVSTAALPLGAQKIDSLALHLHMPRDKAVDAVVSAFTQTGLGVTNSTPSFVEADQGRTSAFTGYTARKVRAMLFGSDSVTTVVIVGDEIRLDDDGTTQLRRLRIDNRAGGNGGKVWAKMVAAAMMLDSASVPEAARSKQ
jgi:hypothetical protein